MFRKVIRARTSSNHIWGLVIWISLIGFMLSLAIWNPDQFLEEILIGLIVLVATLSASVWSTWAILTNKEWELVVDDEVIRWGAARDSFAQTSVKLDSLSAIRFVSYDANHPYELISKGGVRRGIPAFIVFEKKLGEELVGYFRDHHPEIAINVAGR